MSVDYGLREISKLWYRQVKSFYLFKTVSIFLLLDSEAIVYTTGEAPSYSSISLSTIHCSLLN